MSIVQIIAIGLMGGLLALIVKEYNPQISMLIAISTGMIIFLSCVSKLSLIIQSVMDMTQGYKIDIDLIKLIVKIIGISYIAQFAVEMLNDIDQNGIALKVELCSKIVIISMALPILKTLMDMVSNILS